MHGSVRKGGLQMREKSAHRRRVAKVLNMMLWTIIGLATCIGLYFSDRILHAPVVADPASGHVIPFNDHGRMVFITRLDDEMLTWGSLLAVLLFAMAWLIQRLKR
jgi:hypothetical protein